MSERSKFRSVRKLSVPVHQTPSMARRTVTAAGASSAKPRSLAPSSLHFEQLESRQLLAFGGLDGWAGKGRSLEINSAGTWVESRLDRSGEWASGREHVERSHGAGGRGDQGEFASPRSSLMSKNSSHARPSLQDGASKATSVSKPTSITKPTSVNRSTELTSVWVVPNLNTIVVSSRPTVITVVIPSSGIAVISSSAANTGTARTSSQNGRGALSGQGGAADQSSASSWLTNWQVLNSRLTSAVVPVVTTGSLSATGDVTGRDAQDGARTGEGVLSSGLTTTSRNNATNNSSARIVSESMSLVAADTGRLSAAKSVSPDVQSQSLGSIRVDLPSNLFAGAALSTGSSAVLHATQGEVTSAQVPAHATTLRLGDWLDDGNLRRRRRASWSEPLERFGQVGDDGKRESNDRQVRSLGPDLARDQSEESGNFSTDALGQANSESEDSSGDGADGGSNAQRAMQRAGKVQLSEPGALMPGSELVGPAGITGVGQQVAQDALIDQVWESWGRDAGQPEAERAATSGLSADVVGGDEAFAEFLPMASRGTGADGAAWEDVSPGWSGPRLAFSAAAAPSDASTGDHDWSDVVVEMKVLVGDAQSFGVLSEELIATPSILTTQRHVSDEAP